MGEMHMVRKFIDCRDVPGVQCTIAIFAESEEELLEAAIHHAVSAHGCVDTPELRERLRQLFKIEKRRAICS
jgi:predicted small metal-binding protein